MTGVHRASYLPKNDPFLFSAPGGDSKGVTTGRAGVFLTLAKYACILDQMAESYS